ncbi:MAG TPA: acyl-CoA dehydrogenase [Phycicoccus sp.]|nr:acyl-CoA dehydrogenase [Phycicoccus sp.]
MPAVMNTSLPDRDARWEVQREVLLEVEQTDGMASEILSARDVDFLLFEWLRSEELFEREPFAQHSRETAGAVLELAETVATERFAPHARANDLQEPSFDGTTVTLIPEVGTALRAFADAGFLTAGVPESHGGEGLPTSVVSACLAWFHAANTATSGYSLLSMAAANLIRTHGTDEQRRLFAEPLAQGRFTGTMALSEPASGSNLADLLTRAIPQDDGTYRLFGRKMWISGGDHELADNIVHLVLARTPDAAPGTKGISIFIVPKCLVAEDGSLGERNDVVLAGINHKMGSRGTVNTAPVLGDGAHRPGGAAGAVGYLVGSIGQGLPIMFSMMNEARLGVGIAGTAVGYTGYLKSLAYARERLQGRPFGAKPTEPQVALTEHPDVRRMLLAQKAYVEGALALMLYCSRLVDDAHSLEGEAADEALALLGLLTPIAKSFPAQWCLEANSLAIQVMGGAGYTRDHDVEQHYRDNRLNAIHEGTHGIQGLDLLGRKVLLDGGRALGLLVARIHETAERATAAGESGEAYAVSLLAMTARLQEVTRLAGEAGGGADVLAEATAYLEGTGHLVIAWLWLEQWLAAHGKEGAFYDGKRAATAYFFTRELPKVGLWFDLVAAHDGLTTHLDPATL